MCPFAPTNGHDVPWLIDELVPCLAAMVDDVVVGGEDAVGEPVVAHELPNILNRVQLGAFGWQGDDADVAGYDELAGRMPSRLIHQHDRVSAGGDHERDLGQMQGHRFGIAKRKYQPRALAMFGADRAKDIDRFRPLILRGRWPGSAPCPASRDLVLLADPRLILEPYFYGRTLREGCSDFCQFGCEAPFLNASSAYSFWAWWRGRAVSLT